MPTDPNANTFPSSGAKLRESVIFDLPKVPTDNWPLATDTDNLKRMWSQSVASVSIPLEHSLYGIRQFITKFKPR